MPKNSREKKQNASHIFSQRQVRKYFIGSANVPLKTALIETITVPHQKALAMLFTLSLRRTALK